ncbi:MAG: hypothetical protein HRU20_09535 [Pseudomonadales bacterium]|nr:hypothetical protein [Pseudomonadales bacterium]
MKEAYGFMFLLLASIVISGCDTTQCEAALGAETCEALIVEVVEFATT